MRRVYKKRAIGMVLVTVLLAGCKKTASEPFLFVEETVSETALSEQEVPATKENLPDILTPEASGTAIKKTDKAVIDYSNTEDGYVMVLYNVPTEKKLKAQVKGPTTTYTYTIQPEEWETFPLSDGNGSYQITVFENVEDKKYAAVVALSFTVELKDEFAPFLRPNQYVDYADARETLLLAATLVQGKETELEKVEAVYDYVVNNISYDTELAATVKSGYLPELDNVLEKKKGICFDYAALMTGMLRSQSVPCKLVVGYAGETYHAWISVYTEKDGWIDNAIYFDGIAWKRMDPTFASSANQSEAMLKYIGDASNYTEKYIY